MKLVILIELVNINVQFKDFDFVIISSTETSQSDNFKSILLATNKTSKSDVSLIGLID